MNLLEELCQGIKAMGCSMPDGADEILLRYLMLLSKWNHTYNLTAIRDEGEMLSHHLLDSLAVLPHLGGLETLADIGSGAGLPGIVLAIARPDLQVTSVESSQKKAAFQQQVKIDLQLPNVSIYSGRVEQFSRQNWFDGVISRAFSSLAEFIRLAGGLVREGGSLLAMKGRFPSEEVAKIPTDWMVADTIRLDVPGLFAERHLIVMKRH